MSFDAMAWARKQQPSGGATSKLLLLMLANYADADGTCWPSCGLLATDCGVSRSTVMDHVKKLESDNLLSHQSRVTPHGKTSNLFRVHCNPDVQPSDIRMSRIPTSQDVRLPDIESVKEPITTTTSRRLRVEGGKRPETWLSPISAVWEARNGAGSFASIAGQAAKTLKPITAGGTTPADIAERLTRYLDATDSKFWSITKFAQTFGQWTETATPPIVDEWGCLTEYGERVTRPASLR